MYEEDREQALDLYSEIFDEVGNDNAVLQLLGSPTRQAVGLARVYDAKERRQQLAAGYLTEEPGFIKMIEDLREQSDALAPAAVHVDENQISIFDEPDAAADVFENLDFTALAGEGENAQPLPVPEDDTSYPDEDQPAVPQPRAPEFVPVEEPRPVSEPVAEEHTESASDAVEAFLANFTFSDPADEKPAAAPTVPAYIPDGQDEAKPGRTPQSFSARGVRNEPAFNPQSVPRTRKKPLVALLILFVLLAVPVGLVGICLLLVLALLALAVGVSGLASGVWGISAAFTSFSVFADILLTFGLALVLAALGLLFFWLFIRLLFGSIPGLVRGIAALGRKWCYKEVAA